MTADRTSGPVRRGAEPIPLPPRATYRLQFHAGFTLPDATRLVPYLAGLGISHVYASPLLQAASGSTHGYDVCDCEKLSPELGTEAELEDFVNTLHQHGMALVLDIVPNHLGVGTGENRWWWDVLKHGRGSAFATFFDIDWERPDAALRGKILLPVLGDAYPDALAHGDFRVALETGEPYLAYFEHCFPLNPTAWPLERMKWPSEAARVNGDARLLDELIASQHYRLAHWRDAESRLNYRRFFDISSLAGIRVEDEQVFQRAHARVLEWHRRGWVAGFRVDHPDGLRNPREYFARLRAAAPTAWIVAEKILEGDETLPGDWPIEGTTGYDFLNDVGGLFLDSRNERAFTEFYETYTGRSADFPHVLRLARREIVEGLLASELNKLVTLAEKAMGRMDPSGSKLELELELAASIRTALIEWIACFPVYRTYVEPGLEGLPTPRDRAVVHQAAAAAERELNESERSILARFVQVLLGELSPSGNARPGEDGQAELEFVARLQQLTGPSMAKGKEDTAFYRHYRFVALNEVGGDPARFGVSAEKFVARCVGQQERWPHRMLSTSTHDTKRSEDVRARLSVLSEIPQEWTEVVRRWTSINEPYRSGVGPDRNTEYAYYQNLVGAWPVSTERMQSFLLKAVREAKEQTSWREPNPEYEEAVRRFVQGSLADSTFRGDVERFVSVVREPGYVVSLAQTLLKLTAPGVPDLYQGTDLWDFSLVDPDNRRPVDFDRRRGLLAEAAALPPEDAWAARDDGTAKLWLIAKALRLRQRMPDVFAGPAPCDPVWVTGSKSEHVVTWCRAGRVVAIVPRLVIGRGKNWEDTRIALSPGLWRDELSGETLWGGEVGLEERLHRFPVALLSKQKTT